LSKEVQARVDSSVLFRWAKGEKIDRGGSEKRVESEKGGPKGGRAFSMGHGYIFIQ